MRRVVLVTGPPAAGKSAYIAARRAPDDIVIDFDAICGELGSVDRHNHSPAVLKKAAAVRAAREFQVSAMKSGTAWVIRTAPMPLERVFAAKGIGATETVVLATEPEVAKRRAAADGRPAWTSAAIDKWWRAYRPGAGETVITPEGE